MTIRDYSQVLSKYDRKMEHLRYEIQKLELQRDISENIKTTLMITAPLIVEIFNGLQSAFNSYLKLKGYELELENLKNLRDINLRKFEKTIDYLISLNDMTARIMENISKIDDEEAREIFMERFLRFSELILNLTQKLINSI